MEMLWIPIFPFNRSRWGLGMPNLLLDSTRLSLEGHLFGLLPLRSRLTLSYRAADAAPWSLRWTFGDK